jgi:phosphate transport system permease protein
MAELTPSNRNARRVKDHGFRIACIVAAGLAILVLMTLLVSICLRGFGRIDWAFITEPMSSIPSRTGIGPALIGSISILFVCAITAVPLGVATAILLEEYQPKAKWLRTLHGFIQSNITNLAGVPSIVYGILGFTAFVLFFNALGTAKDPWFDMGQNFYHEYSGPGGQSFYVHSYEDAPLNPVELDHDLTFYPSLRAAAAGGPLAEVEVVPAGELEALRSKVDSRLFEINAVMKDLLDDAKVDRKPQIDEAKAQEMAAAMLDPFDEQIKGDLDEMKALAATKLVEMDGMGFRNLLLARRSLYQELTDMEFKAAGLSGVILEGTTPLNKDVKKWYYFQFPFGSGVLAGGLTLMLVILPIIIVSSQEAIRAVSQEMRSGVLALGGTKWQSIEKVVLPSAIPGICTGSILALSRAIGEAAPILLIGYVGLQVGPDHLMAAFAALPLEIYNWTSEPDAAFRVAAAAGIIVLLAVLFSFNAIAVFIRYKAQKANS